jgi:hypothetical protein
MKESTPENKPNELGTVENPIIDPGLTREEALRQNPNFPMDEEIFEKQVLLPIIYLCSLDGKYHQGQIVIDKDLENDVKDFLAFLIEQKFPIEKMTPVADKEINFNDNVSMDKNNCSGFNPRNIANTDRPSNHAYGRAFDINPRQNPYIRGETTEPEGAVYNIEIPGTLTAESPIVKFLKDRGWIWGGDFIEFKDYHHFEKPLTKK